MLEQLSIHNGHLKISKWTWLQHSSVIDNRLLRSNACLSHDVQNPLQVRFRVLTPDAIDINKVYRMFQTTIRLLNEIFMESCGSYVLWYSVLKGYFFWYFPEAPVTKEWNLSFSKTIEDKSCLTETTFW